jgi:hypothetical protein
MRRSGEIPLTCGKRLKHTSRLDDESRANVSKKILETSNIEPRTRTQNLKLKIQNLKSADEKFRTALGTFPEAVIPDNSLEKFLFSADERLRSKSNKKP